MKIPNMVSLNIPAIYTDIANLAREGTLATSEDIVYLDIDDDFIHRSFPHLKKPSIQKPDYFGEDLIGAHITVIYPEENQRISENDLGEKHPFSIKDILSADIKLKRYYVLRVNAPSLLQLRHKYGLGEKLLFKDYLIDFHITIGVELLA